MSKQHKDNVYLGEAGLHVKLLENGIHVTCRSTVLQSDEA